MAAEYWEKASSQDTTTRFKRWKSSDSKIFLNGLILEGDCLRFQTLANEKIETVVLNSVEGDVDEAVCIGQEIQKRKLRTQVAGMCLGPCFELLFLSGREPQIRDGFVGMYASPDNPREFDEVKARSALETQIKSQDLRLRMQLPDASEAQLTQIKQKLTHENLQKFRMGFENYIRFKNHLGLKEDFDQAFQGESLNAAGQAVVILPSANFLRKHRWPAYEGAANLCLTRPLQKSLQFIVK